MFKILGFPILDIAVMHLNYLKILKTQNLQYCFL